MQLTHLFTNLHVSFFSRLLEKTYAMVETGPAFHFSWHLIGSLKQPGAIKLIKVIKSLSKRCKKLCQVATVQGV